MSKTKVAVLIILGILLSLVANILINTSSIPLVRYGLASLQLGLISLAIIAFTLYTFTVALNKLCTENILKLGLALALVIFVLPTYAKLAYQFAKAALRGTKIETSMPAAQIPQTQLVIPPAVEIEKTSAQEVADAVEPQPAQETQDIFVPAETIKEEPQQKTQQPTDTTVTTTPQPEKITSEPAPSTKEAVTTVANLQELNTLLKESNVLVLKCSASWCPPCREMKSIFEKVAQDLQKSVRFSELDVDTFLDIHELNVSLLPTVIYYKNGQEISRTTGFRNEDELRADIAKLMA